MEEFYKTIIRGLENMFKIQVPLSLTKDKEFAISEATPFNGNTGGLLKLKASNATAYLALNFTKASFLAVINAMLGMTETDINPDFEPTSLEFLNVTIGNAHIPLQRQGFTFEKSDSIVLKNYVRNKIVSPTIEHKIFEYKTPQGNFQFGIFLKKS